MKKIITYLLVLTSLAANGQIVNKFRDSSWFKSGVRFDSTLVFSKGAGNGKVWTSDATGKGTWQTFTASGVTQSDLDDSISAVRSVRKVDSLYRSADSIIYKINGIRYSIRVDSQATFNLSKNAAGDSIIIHHNGVRYSAKDSIADVTNLATKTALSDSVSTLRNVRKSDTSYIGLNGTRDSIVYTNVINGTTYRNAVRDSSIATPTFSLSKNTARDSIVTIFSGVRSAVKDSSIATPTLTFAKSATRDSMVLTYNGSRTALVDSFSRARKVDTIYRTAGKDSIIFTVNNVRYAVKDSLGGSAGWSLTGNAGTSGYPSNFIGTTDNRDVIFKRNNAFIFGLYSNGIVVGISTADNKYIEVQGSTTGNPATGYSYIGYGGFQTYTSNESGYLQSNLSGKNFGIGIGTDGITRIKTGTTSGIDPAIYINQAYGGNGNVGIGGSPVTSAKLAVTSTSSGFLPPVMTTTQRNAISSPATGLMIFCSDCTATDASTGVTQTYNGSTWKNFW